MKARNEWVRKKTKREIREKKDKGIVDFVQIVKHFFKDLPQWIREIEKSYWIHWQSKKDSG